MQNTLLQISGQSGDWSDVPDLIGPITRGRSPKETRMRYMMTYDLMETVRNTNQWLGATALSMASYPVFSALPNPCAQLDGRLGRSDGTHLTSAWW